MVIAALTAAVAVQSASVCLRELSFQMLWVAAAVAAVITAAAAAGQQGTVAERGCCIDVLNFQHQLTVAVDNRSSSRWQWWQRRRQSMTRRQQYDDHYGQHHLAVAVQQMVKSYATAAMKFNEMDRPPQLQLETLRPCQISMQTQPMPQQQ